MKCLKQKLIQKYLDNEATPVEEELVRKHSAKCANCRQWLDFGCDLNSLTKIIPITTPPEYLTERIIRRLNSPVNEHTEKVIKSNWVSWLAPIVPVALLILFFVFARAGIWSRAVQVVRVQFEVKLESAQTVALAGDFNNWNPESYKLIRNNGAWKIEIPLKPGRYQYVFVVNGTNYLPDPKSEETINDGYGNKNSVIDVTKI